MGHSEYSFSKPEKLTGKKKIEELFRSGSSFYLDTFQVKYQSVSDEEQCHRLLITVPKKNFKRAVDRNLLKRRIREAYRLNKKFLLREDQNEFFYIAFIYLSKNILTFNEIEDQLIACLKRLGNVVETKK
ncbi:MAG: ribonuclease P protein component [Cyclobacteriaceae bacterium]